MDDELYNRVASLRQLVIKSKQRFTQQLRGKLYRVLLDSEELLITGLIKGSASNVSYIETHSHRNSRGSIELGAVLYWLNHPSEEWRLLVEDIVFILYLIEGEPLPKSMLTPSMIDMLKEQNVIPDFIAEESAIYACSRIIPAVGDEAFWLVEKISDLLRPEVNKNQLWN